MCSKVNVLLYLLLLTSPDISFLPIRVINDFARSFFLVNHLKFDS